MNSTDNENSITRRQFVRLGAASAGALALGVSVSEAAEHFGEQQSNQKRLTLSWFIKRQDYVPDPAFDRLLDLLSKNRSSVDEVGLFEAPSNAWLPPLEFLSQTADIMARRFDSLRQARVRRVGICVINTIGCISDEERGGAPDLPFPKMVGLEGREADLSGCPNRPEFHAYTKAKYAYMARVAPDYIWVSDDMRMQSHGAAATWGCFCPVCLRLLSDLVGHACGREALVRALNDPASGGLRKAWVEQNACTIESVYPTIGDAIHEVNPKIQTGMMTLGMGYTGYSGSAYDRWFTALRATKARPGQGFYSDIPVGLGNFGGNRMELLTKAGEVSRQIEAYPAQAQDRQYEFETWPDGRLGKEPRTAINELAVAVAVGCNGMVLDTLGWGPPYDEYLPLFEHLSGARIYLESILKHAAGLPPSGLWSAWSPQIMANRSVRSGENWLSPQTIGPELPYDMNLAGILAQIGIPLTARRADNGVVLAGRIAEALDDADLRSILAGGVLMDTMALRVLIDRGLGDLAGVRIDTSYPDFTTARMTADPLNGRYKGALHWAMVPPGFKSNDVLAPAAPGVRTLAELEDEVGQAKGPCMTAFENSAGGRVVVTGYSAWWYLQFIVRRYQMLEVADWISRGKVPVRIEEALPLTPFVRMNVEGTRGVVVLFNTGLSPIDTATVLIRAPMKTSVRLVAVDKGPVMQRFSETRGWGVRVRNLPAWSTVSLLLS